MRLSFLLGFLFVLTSPITSSDSESYNESEIKTQSSQKRKRETIKDEEKKNDSENSSDSEEESRTQKKKIDQKIIKEKEFENNQKIEHPYHWSPSLNFLYRSQIAKDDTSLYDSNHISEWHVDQAAPLALFYYAYQHPPGNRQAGYRNVVKIMLSVLYEEENKTTSTERSNISSIKIKNIPFDRMFINGISYPGYNKPYNLGNNQYQNNVSKQVLILPRGVTAQIDIDSVRTGSAYFDSKKNLLNFLRQFLPDPLPKNEDTYWETNLHAEQTALIYLHQRASESIQKLTLPTNTTIKAIVLNIASFRDLCLVCSSMVTNWLHPKVKPWSHFLHVTLKNTLVEELKKKGYNIDSSIPLKILTSGISNPQISINDLIDLGYQPLKTKQYRTTKDLGLTPDAYHRRNKQIDITEHDFFHFQNPYRIEADNRKQEYKLVFDSHYDQSQ